MGSVRTLFAAGIALLLAASLAAQPHPKLSAGPMPTYSEMTETLIWVQTTRPADVVIRYRAAGQDREPMTATPPVRTGPETHHVAQVRIPGLPMGTTFDYELWIDGERVPRDYPLRFQTIPHWRWLANPPQPPNFSFALGSCAYINDAPFDRPGTPYGQGMEIFESIRAKSPDFMLWMGDNVYFREADWLTPDAMAYRWTQNRALPELQPMLGGIHHYATWDDHDYGPNNSDRSFRLKGPALELHKLFFPAVTWGTPDEAGVFQRFEWGDVEFFLTDNRYHRSPNSTPNDDPAKTMLGRAQLQWLKDSLLNSDKTFKVIVNGGQMINPMIFFEAFGHFPAEQKDLFDFIASSGVEGVLFLSGDRHATELLKVQWPGAPYPWYEFTSSPLTAGPGRNAAEADNPARVPGTWVNVRNFGTVEVSGPWRNRVLTLRTFNTQGEELWKHEIREQELRRPRATREAA